MSEFVYRPSKVSPPIAQIATLGVKFSQEIRILDPWYIVGGTKWTRSLYRLRHPIIYSKRGILGFYRRIKRIFIKEPPMIWAREWKSKEELLHLYPEERK